MSDGACLFVGLGTAMLLGINKTLESPNNRVSLGSRMNSYLHRAHYSQLQLTPLGRHMRKHTLKQFETIALTRQANDVEGTT